MIPWGLLDSAPVPGGSETLYLYRRDTEFSIRVDGCELMNNRVHGLEDALAERVCARLVNHPSPKVLVGGLGTVFVKIVVPFIKPHYLRDFCYQRCQF